MYLKCKFKDIRLKNIKLLFVVSVPNVNTIILKVNWIKLAGFSYSQKTLKQKAHNAAQFRRSGAVF